MVYAVEFTVPDPRFGVLGCLGLWNAWASGIPQAFGKFYLDSRIQRRTP